MHLGKHFSAEHEFGVANKYWKFSRSLGSQLISVASLKDKHIQLTF